MSAPIPPLNWQVPIVDAQGRPTDAFMRYFQQIGLNDAGASEQIGALQQATSDLQEQIDGLEPTEGSGGAVMPLVDGSEPPVFITDGAGSLIAVPWSE